MPLSQEHTQWQQLITSDHNTAVNTLFVEKLKERKKKEEK